MLSSQTRLIGSAERGVDGGDLPVSSLDVRDSIKMAVAAKNGQAVLDRDGRDPRVVSRNRRAIVFERYAQPGIRGRGLFGHGKNVELTQMRRQPPFISGAVSRLCDAVLE